MPRNSASAQLAIHPGLATEARAVVTDPARFAAMPAIRMLAWAALLAERGQRLDQPRIARMQRAQTPESVA